MRSTIILFWTGLAGASVSLRVVLERPEPGEALGVRFGLTGNDQDSDRPHTVIAITPGGAVDRQQRLRIGDTVLSVNGIELAPSATVRSKFPSDWSHVVLRVRPGPPGDSILRISCTRRDLFGIEVSRVNRVTKVKPDTPAAEGGRFREGDTIVSVNSEPILHEELGDRLRTFSADTKLNLGVMPGWLEKPSPSPPSGHSGSSQSRKGEKGGEQTEKLAGKSRAFQRASASSSREESTSPEWSALPILAGLLAGMIGLFAGSTLTGWHAAQKAKDNRERAQADKLKAEAEKLKAEAERDRGNLLTQLRQRLDKLNVEQQALTEAKKEVPSGILIMSSDARHRKQEIDQQLQQVGKKIQAVEAQMKAMTGTQKITEGFGTWVGRYAGESGFAVFEVGDNVFAALQQITDNIPDPLNLGFGRDVPNGPWKSIQSGKKLKLQRAWKIENPKTQEIYVSARKGVETEVARLRKHFGERSKMPKYKSGLANASDAICRASGDELNESINETFLLHGSKPETLATMLANGVNEKFSGGLFGEGSYFADNLCKSDQYVNSLTSASHTASATDPSLRKLHRMLYRTHDHPREKVYYVFVCRVVLGWFGRTKDGETLARQSFGFQSIFDQFSSSIFDQFSSSGTIWAKRGKELATISGGPNPPVHYHSMVVEAGISSKVKRHNEILQFHQSRIYPEFLLAYTRCLSDGSSC